MVVHARKMGPNTGPVLTAVPNEKHYKIVITVDPDRKIRKPPTTQFYSTREQMDKDASKLRKAGFKITVWAI